MRFKQIKPQPVRQKYRLYSPTALVNAYKMVREEGASVLRASKCYSVPENTLRDRVLGKVDPETVVMGKVPLFDNFEEATIMNHFKRMADMGYGYTQQECLDVATGYAVQLGKRTKDKPLSMKWMKGFLQRWPEMRVVKPRALEHVRAKTASEQVVRDYFENLKTCITANGLEDKPHMIFNVDEKGISIEHRPPYIVASSQYSAQAVTSGKGKTVTILGAGSACGSAVPPYFVFPGKRMNNDLLNGASPGASGTMSESGWSNTQVFEKYLTEHFIEHIPGQGENKVLLLLDGHRSHVALTLADWAKRHNIIMFILPAHTSHILQPLDVACYGPFQKIYNAISHKVIRQTHAAITQYNICEIACQAYTRAISAENLQAGFRKTGIYPMNKDVVPKHSMFPSNAFQGDDLDSQSSDSTVAGGVVADMFEARENKLIQVKSEKVKKPRNTKSKLVSGKELTSEQVIHAIEEHEKSHTPRKPPASSSCKPPASGSCKRPASKTVKKKAPCVPARSPKPGPSHVNLLETSSESETDTDEEKCCVCSRFQPEEFEKDDFLRFVKWAQCDGIANGKPCMHWTHLSFCTPVRVLRKGVKFFCPHCKPSEE